MEGVGTACGPVCNAPFSSMHVMPNGDVRACCQNVWHPLGNVAEAGLREIWEGAATSRLRDHLSDGDLSLGCELCAVDVEGGAGERAFLHAFDDLPPVDPRLVWPRQLELTLSTACNLQCVMCNGELSSAIRLHRERRPPMASVFHERFFRELDSFLPHLDRVTLLGGEPLMGAEPLRVLDRLIELGLRPRCHVITNGTRWNARVERILRELPVHVAVSIDGASAATNEAIRVGVDHERLLANIDRLRTASRAGGGGFSLAFSLMTVNWHEAADLLLWADELGAPVNINTVTNPPRFSLHALPPEGIGAVRDELHARDRWAEHHLSLNLPTWRSIVRQVDVLTEAAERAGHRSSSVAAERASVLASEWADGGQVVAMHVDESLVITGFEPDASAVFGFDVRHVVGGSSIGFMRALQPRLGRLVGTTLELEAGGVERREFHFDDEGSGCTVIAVMARRPGGETWFLAHRAGARPVRVEVASHGSAARSRTSTASAPRIETGGE